MLEQNALIRYDLILGSRRLSNYAWALITFGGGLGFLSAGISSYFGIEFLPFTSTDGITFIPQGIVMTFYGSAGVLFSIFLLINISFNVGGGYNKYNKILGQIEIFRLGFPIQTKEIYISYEFKEIKCIRLSIKEGLNPKREIYLQTKDQRQIPLTRVGEPLLLSNVEEEAVDLASFIGVPLEA